MSCSGGLCAIPSCSGCSGNCPAVACFDACALKCGYVDMYRSALWVWNGDNRVVQKTALNGTLTIAGFNTNQGEVLLDLTQIEITPPLQISSLWEGVPVTRNAGAFLPPRDPVPVLFEATRFRPTHVVTVKVGYQLTPPTYCSLRDQLLQKPFSIPPNCLSVLVQVDAPQHDQTYIVVGPLLRSIQCASLYDQ